ncbi:DUF294 nucleotidyltransferase-like domain-containing protein [Tepidimonas charontis]|uniref:KpsF: sugar isomerase, KpsF/GutQ family n=1 Tax=Tepidimonas charontis TaxID=2267262 RepID=A0A554XEK7_9BURK|nr:DUF294 nucleotidyltransferase-like domain-containing protein [Tepidimonas charontis]TSE34270.1 kpsF: sugar isomerase, KpsF/GutQ family [Tepidimonas charontis]
MTNLDWRLGDLPARVPVALPATAPLRTVLQTMSARRIGSVLLLDARGALAGILTRGDVLERIVLAGVGLEEPAARVMSQPVQTLGTDDTLYDAVLMMARAGIRHVPVLDATGQPVNIVSERDLFALQRQSLQHVGHVIERATTLADFQRAAAAVRDYTRHLQRQGVQARALTGLIASLNDRLTQRLVTWQLQAHGLPADAMCWMALGSEGRGEQTLATDQDNALIFQVEAGQGLEVARARWLAFGRAVNEALNACGYPLCHGGIMAGNPACCLTLPEWQARFAAWIDGGTARQLLQAAVFFDLRAIAGRTDWVQTLSDEVLQRVQRTPRFVRLMAQAHLEHPVPLLWHGGIRTRREGAHRWLDLKLQGTALIVEAARVLALAHGVAATDTRLRLQQAGRAAGVPEGEVQAWVAAFDHLQALRLAQQSADPADAAPNRIDVAALDAVAMQTLKAALAAIRTLQQRLQLDYLR